jgi:hypothetical protein
LGARGDEDSELGFWVGRAPRGEGPSPRGVEVELIEVGGTDGDGDWDWAVMAGGFYCGEAPSFYWRRRRGEGETSRRDETVAASAACLACLLRERGREGASTRDRDGASS